MDLAVRRLVGNDEYVLSEMNPRASQPGRAKFSSLQASAHVRASTGWHWRRALRCERLLTSPYLAPPRALPYDCFGRPADAGLLTGGRPLGALAGASSKPACSEMGQSCRVLGTCTSRALERGQQGLRDRVFGPCDVAKLQLGKAQQRRAHGVQLLAEGLLIGRSHFGWESAGIRSGGRRTRVGMGRILA